MARKTVHYIGFRGDEFVRAYKIFGGPVMIHRTHDPRSQRDIDPEKDVVIFANGESEDYVHSRNSPDVVGFGYTAPGSIFTDPNG